MDRRHFLTGLALSASLAASGARAAAAPTLKFRDMYSRGTQLSEAAEALVGQRISMLGYMAPPLKPEVKFFVLTKLPMATCPFCNDAADWPTDLVVAYADEPLQVYRYADALRVEGMFETGVFTDPDTGFVSLARLRGVQYSRV